MISTFKCKISRDIWDFGEAKKMGKGLCEEAKMIFEVMNATENLSLMEVFDLQKKSGFFSVEICEYSTKRIAFDFKDGAFFNIEII